MKRYTIEQKFKSAAAFLVILILFPYIVSVFVNGVDPEETTNENFYIRVKASEEEEADGIAEVHLTLLPVFPSVGEKQFDVFFRY